MTSHLESRLNSAVEAWNEERSQLRSDITRVGDRTQSQLSEFMETVRRESAAQTAELRKDMAAIAANVASSQKFNPQTAIAFVSLLLLFFGMSASLVWFAYQSGMGPVSQMVSLHDEAVAELRLNDRKTVSDLARIETVQELMLSGKIK